MVDVVDTDTDTDTDIAVDESIINNRLDGLAIDDTLNDLVSTGPLDIDSMGMNSTALLNSWTRVARSTRQTGCPLSMASCPLSMMRCPFCTV